jgi:cellulose synthase (UDP-forming)
VRSESLTWLQLLAPTLFVFGALYLLANIFPAASRWGRYLIFVTVWSVVFWYLKWRFETVLPTRGYWYEIGWVWFCFAIELLAIADQLILYLHVPANEQSQCGG